MKRRIALLLAAAFCFAAAACGPAQRAHADPLALVPLPNGRAELGDGRVDLPSPLGYDAGIFQPEFVELFAQRTGIALAADAPAFLRVNQDESLPPEGYRLRVAEENGVEIEAADERGLCWALTTLAALTQDGTLPACGIEDAPYYPHRGFLMDSARHFFPVETVKALIELTSMVKLNVFHWHLTDDQGWRIESKLYPALQEQNIIPGEYYTQEEIREVVEFARVRGVEVIPEVDVPGHASAILSAYPDLSCSGKPVKVADYPGIRSVILCAGQEPVFDLLFPLLEEIAGLFPSARFHLGGDEAPKDEWAKCPRCQQRMEEEDLASLDELQGWFTARLAAHMKTLGKSAICWNESLLSERFPQDVEGVTIQYWAEVHSAGQVRRFWERNSRIIFSDEFGAHFDLPYGALPLKQAYSYGPGALGFQGKGLPALGLEACIWTEFIDTQESLAAMTFPRTYATAEAAWTAPERKDYKDFRRRLDLWLAKYPGIGFTPPEQADPRFIARYKSTFAFLRKLSSALDKDHPDNAGMGGKLEWRYALRWFKYYFL